MKSNSQSGNVLFIILIAVGLLASLSYAVTSSSRNGGKSLSDEKSQLYATEILEYAQNMANAVTQLRLRGCDEDEISFFNDDVGGYTNNNAPPDFTCHVFRPEGGGLSWNTPQTGVTVSAPVASDWLITTGNSVQNIGTTGTSDDNADLVLLLNDVTSNLCLKINNLLGVTNPSDAPPEDTEVDIGKFIGVYDYEVLLGDEDTALSGKKAACFYNDDQTEYVFYKVLIAR